MKRIVRWALPALLLAGPIAANAAEPAPFRVGVGGSLSLGGLTSEANESFSFVPVGFANVLVPIWIGDLRIEPEFGYFNFDEEDEMSFGGESMKETFSTSIFRIGAGVAWSWEVAERTRLYAGPRFGLIFRSSEFEEPDFDGEEGDEVQVTTTITSTDFWVGAGVGGEAFITPAFSLGVEAQFNYISFGEPDVDRKPDLDPEPDGFSRKLDRSALSTQVLVSARIYFM